MLSGFAPLFWCLDGTKGRTIRKVMGGMGDFRFAGIFFFFFRSLLVHESFFLGETL